MTDTNIGHIHTVFQLKDVHKPPWLVNDTNMCRSVMCTYHYTSKLNTRRIYTLWFSGNNKVYSALSVKGSQAAVVSSVVDNNHWAMKLYFLRQLTESGGGAKSILCWENMSKMGWWEFALNKWVKVHMHEKHKILNWS